MSRSDLVHDSQTLLRSNYQCTPKRGRSGKKNGQSDTVDVDDAGDTRMKRVKLRLAYSGMFSSILLEAAQ